MELFREMLNRHGRFFRLLLMVLLIMGAAYFYRSLIAAREARLERVF